MSKSEQPITSTDTPDDHNIWSMELSHTWKNIEFVQQVVARMPSIEAIERELQEIDGGNA